MYAYFPLRAFEQNPCAPSDPNTPYRIVQVQAVIGLLCDEFESICKILVEQLDLLGECTASDTSNHQFLQLWHV